MEIAIMFPYIPIGTPRHDLKPSPMEVLKRLVDAGIQQAHPLVLEMGTASPIPSSPAYLLCHIKSTGYSLQNHVVDDGLIRGLLGKVEIFRMFGTFTEGFIENGFGNQGFLRPPKTTIENALQVRFAENSIA